MAEWQLITAVLTNSTTVTTSLTSSDYASARQAVQNIMKNGGFWDSNNVFYPISGIQSLAVS
jgi:hypothetical protein